MLRYPENPPASSYRHERVLLIPLELPEEAILVAQYNPSQLQLEQSATWSTSSSKSDNAPALEFASTAPRSLSMELFFDSYEASGADMNVKKQYLDRLNRLIRVMDPKGSENLRRPPLVKVVWGSCLEPFTGVIQSVSTKITMFLADGTPVRATCSVKLMEATRSALGERAVNRVLAPPLSAGVRDDLDGDGIPDRR